MAENEDCLSLSPSEDEFSGFEEADINNNKKTVDVKIPEPMAGTSKGKSKTSKTKGKGKIKAKKSTSSSTETNINKNEKSNLIDLDKLTPSSVERLKAALGLEDVDDRVERHEGPRDNLIVEIDNNGPDPDYVVEGYDNVSSGKRENRGPFHRSPLDALEHNFDSVFFDETASMTHSQLHYTQTGDDVEWDLPTLKAPKLGDNISQSLAKLITTSCTAQCVTDDIVERYKIPSNCPEMGAPSVNGEVYQKMDKRSQNNDKNFKSIQGMVATAMMPIVKIASLLKKEIAGNVEARQCVSDAVTLLGQVQYNMSLRRRYLIRPSLKKGYAGLCNMNTPITTQLFGDDITSEMKKCEASNRLNNDLTPAGRGTQRGTFRGCRSFGSGYGRRFHPYNRRASHTMGRGSGPKNFNQEISSTQGSSNSEFRGDTSSTQVDGVGRSNHIKQYLQNRKVPTRAITLILQSWRSGTQKQYDLAWRKWCLWCSLRKRDPISASEEDVLAYLSFLCLLKKSYSVINTHKCTIVQTLMILGNRWCSNPALLSRFMKGLFVKGPPRPRYSLTWDVSKVLTFLRTIDDENDLKMLTFKTVSLIALSTAARSQTLIALKLSNMYRANGTIKFLFTDPLKTSKLGKKFEIKISHYSEEDLCPLHTLLKYIEVTSSVRKSDQLFISFVTCRAITTSTLARWLRLTLQMSGIDTDRFKAHSFRSASVSAARRAGCSVKEILQTADWSSSRTFYNFYLREQEESDIPFTQAVFHNM